MNSTLKLSTKLSSSGKTQLDEYFVMPPFKVMTLSAYADSWENGLSAMQMSSSPGLLAGDRVDIQITLEKSTALSSRSSFKKSRHLLSQSIKNCFEPNK